MQWSVILVLLAILVLIEGCASKLPGHDGERKPMLDIYQDSIGAASASGSVYNESGSALRARKLHHGVADLAAYTRNAHNEIAMLFPLLANPKIVLFVFPHIAEGVPVPGYSTSFSLYERDHYALPAEHLRHR